MTYLIMALICMLSIILNLVRYVLWAELGEWAIIRETMYLIMYANVHTYHIHRVSSKMYIHFE